MNTVPDFEEDDEIFRTLLEPDPILFKLTSKNGFVLFEGNYASRENLAALICDELVDQVKDLHLYGSNTLLATCVNLKRLGGNLLFEVVIGNTHAYSNMGQDGTVFYYRYVQVGPFNDFIGVSFHYSISSRKFFFSTHCHSPSRSYVVNQGLTSTLTTSTANVIHPERI